nr:NADH dehydrogenase subunit 5 [Chelurotropella siamensis]
MFNFYYFWSMVMLFFSLVLFYNFMIFLSLNIILFLEWNILSINSSSLSMTLLLDWMSLLFMSCVFLISSMVILYSKDYMINDIFNYSFLILILLFIVSMFFLIISPNMVIILLGWDGLGLVSYCLVIYFSNYKSYNAGMLTILTNRVGDNFIILSLYYMFNYGDWNYIYYLYFYWEEWMYYMMFLIIMASFTKSAQIPFSSWLPAAMAAPTPVSSLVHSSTLVTANVYLLIRFKILFVNLDLSFFLFLSLLTMFMAGLAANFEFDLKKIIALSTLSQLGMMMTILFLGSSSISFFHLLIHAFFKALFFLCAGLIIHCMSDTQDIRYMGNLIFQLPFTCSCFCISSLSLCGLPFLSGFYCKDFILEYCSLSNMNFFIYVILFLSIGLTVSYSFRLIYYCVGNYNGLFVYQSCIESFNMLISMMLLTLLSICSGSMLSWLIFPYPLINIMPLYSKMLPLFIVLLGVYLGYELTFVNWFYSFNSHILVIPISFLGWMWFMPYFSTSFTTYNSLSMSKFYWNFNDSMWGEYYMSRLIPQFNYIISSKMFLMENRNLVFMLLYLMFMFMIILF